VDWYRLPSRVVRTRRIVKLDSIKVCFESQQLEPGLIPRECASSSSGAKDHRKEEHHDVTERQAHGSQPV
jgi:hypothetical protein